MIIQIYGAVVTSRKKQKQENTLHTISKEFKKGTALILIFYRIQQPDQRHYRQRTSVHKLDDQKSNSSQLTRLSKDRSFNII